MNHYHHLLSIVFMVITSIPTLFAQKGELILSSDGSDEKFGNTSGPSHHFKKYAVYNENARYGVKRTSDNTIVLPAKFKDVSIDEKTNLVFVYNEARKVGLFDPDKNTFYFPIVYQSIQLNERNFGYGNGFRYKQSVTLEKENKEYELAVIRDDSVTTHITGLNYLKTTQAKDLIILMKNSKYGLYSSSKDSLVLAMAYDTIASFSAPLYQLEKEISLFKVRKGTKNGIFSSVPELILPVVYDSVSVTGATLIGWSQKNITVYPNEGNIWEYKRPLKVKGNQDVIAFQDKKGKWDLLRMANQKPLIEKTLFDSLMILQKQSLFDFEGLNENAPVFAFKGKDLYLIQPRDTVQLTKIKDAQVLNIFYNKFVCLSSKGKKGVYSYNLEEIVPLKFDQVMPWFGTNRQEKYWATKSGKSWYFYEGKKVFDSIQADSVRIFDVQAYCALKDGKYALINRTQNVSSGFIYDFIELKMQSGEKLARIDSEYYYLSESGKTRSAEMYYSKSGYGTLAEIEEAFMLALTSSDDSLLYAFADKLTPDNHSFEYMNVRLADYRNFFKDFSSWKRQDALNRYYNKLVQIKQKLIRKSEGQPLQNKGFKDPFMQKVEINKLVTLEGTENGIIIQLSDNPDNSYRVKLGELFLIDGHLKTFTMPKL